MTQLLTLQQVSDRLQIPVATIRFWRSRHEGPQAMKIGKHLRFTEQAVEDYLAEQKLAGAR